MAGLFFTDYPPSWEKIPPVEDPGLYILWGNWGGSVGSVFDSGPMCSSPTRGTEHFVYATGDPSCGRFPPSFIHQVIIITRLNKLYNCMSRPEDGLRCRQGIKPPLELTPLDLQIIKLNKYTDIERYNKYSNKLVCDMAISIGFGGKRGDSHQHSCCCARADITLACHLVRYQLSYHRLSRSFVYIRHATRRISQVCPEA